MARFVFCRTKRSLLTRLYKHRLQHKSIGLFKSLVNSSPSRIQKVPAIVCSKRVYYIATMMMNPLLTKEVMAKKKNSRRGDSLVFSPHWSHPSTFFPVYYFCYTRSFYFGGRKAPTLGRRSPQKPTEATGDLDINPTLHGYKRAQVF